MNGKQFKNLLYFGCNTIAKLHLIDNSFYEGLNEIRLSNSKYNNQAEQIYHNPNHLTSDPKALELLNLIRKDLTQECRNIGVTFVFLKIDKNSYKNERYVLYEFQGVKLTRLINI